MDCGPPGSSVHGHSLGKNTGVGYHALLQGIFPTQGMNPGLLHCRQIRSLSEPPGKPKNTGVGSYSFSRELPDPGINLGSPALQVDSLPAELPGKPSFDIYIYIKYIYDHNCGHISYKIMYPAFLIQHFNINIFSILKKAL